MYLVVCLCNWGQRYASIKFIEMLDFCGLCLLWVSFAFPCVSIGSLSTIRYAYIESWLYCTHHAVFPGQNKLRKGRVLSVDLTLKPMIFRVSLTTVNRESSGGEINTHESIRLGVIWYWHSTVQVQYSSYSSYCRALRVHGCSSWLTFTRSLTSLLDQSSKYSPQKLLPLDRDSRQRYGLHPQVDYHPPIKGDTVHSQPQSKSSTYVIQGWLHSIGNIQSKETLEYPLDSFKLLHQLL